MRLTMLTTDLTLGTFNNPYLLAGKFGDYDFTGEPYVDFGASKTEDEKKKTGSSVLTGKTIAGMPIEEFNKLDSSTKAMLMYQDAQERQERYRREERDPEFMRQQANVLLDAQDRQMARAQKYGKESAFYGFMYQGVPNLMAQAAFSRYAFAPEMVKGVQDAYSRIDLAGAAKPSGRQTYMTVNPMGGIG